MNKRDALILGGAAALLLFFLLREKDRLSPKDLEGGEIPGGEEEFPDYSSWLDRNKILLDPGVSGSGTTVIVVNPYDQVGTGDTGDTGSGDIGAGSKFNVEKPKSEFNWWDWVWGIGGGIWTGKMIYDWIKDWLNRERGDQRKEPPKSGGSGGTAVPDTGPSPEELQKMELRKAAFKAPEPKPTLPPAEKIPRYETQLKHDVQTSKPTPGIPELGAIAAGAAGAAAAVSKMVTRNVGKLMRIAAKASPAGVVVPPSPTIFKPAIEAIAGKIERIKLGGVKAV